MLLQPGYIFEGLEIVFFRTLLVGASPRSTEEISEFDQCLCVNQFQPCHLHGKLTVVSFMFLDLYALFMLNMIIIWITITIYFDFSHK